ncbi:HAD-IB family hydrolase [Acinetobacter sp. S40]|uniref:HAD-IB family hydrolase n=1 Tax=unclassified Acinetobacter TaxID=196816 RepID=UPI00190A7B56|nr:MULTISPECIES: HAD-IB family hydrolase [unclassified Acinetobacter]MBJ9985291.1 HAD-IB family hydrolase [Acinetobacter sp. S40]MBK0063853.1 HAD-IB family hydrolase [Acinetobacter sp. S55]MBK0067079.1 HAD-IB family hydrolase [Acinetobacter sp. S54]
MYATSETNKNINLALFDFDGTLCTKDSFTGFIFYTLSKRHIMRKGLKILPWIQAYYLKLYPADAMRAKLFTTMFKGNSAEQLQQLGQDYAKTLLKSLDSQLLQRLLQHQSQGDKVVLVSASIDLYLKPVCELLNIDLICTQVEILNGIITGEYSTPDCSSEQKKIRIHNAYHLNDYAHVYAYGNSYEDLEMFSLADSCYMVGEDQQLPRLADVKKLA